MAVFEFSLFSKDCGGQMSVAMILPIFEKQDERIAEGERFQTLWFLHGGGGDHLSALHRTNIEYYAVKNKLAVVFPSVGRCHYANVPELGDFFDYLSDELPSLLRKYFPLSPAREDNFVCGTSAGALGAAKLAFTFPERYCAAGLFSMPPERPSDFEARFGREDPLVKRLISLFGDDLGALDGGPEDVGALAARYAAEGDGGLALFCCCGEDDPGFAVHQNFVEELSGLGIPLTSVSGPGGHAWSYWNAQFGPFFDWLPLKERDFFPL